MALNQEHEAYIFAIDVKEGTVSLDIKPEDIDSWIDLWKEKVEIKIKIEKSCD